VQFDVAPEDAGKRLDRFLAENMPDTSRVRIQEWIRGGRVQVNQSGARPSLRLEPSDRVEVEPAPAQPLRAFAENIPLEILYEDDDLAAINKPAGMTVHAGAGVTEGTLVNALLHHFGSLSGVSGEMRPGIVHRLDRHTSGVLLVAKNDRAHQALARQFESRKVEKTYWAVVQGRLSESDLMGGRLAGRGIYPQRVEADGHWWVRLEMAIRRDPRHRVKMTALAPRTFMRHPGDRFAPEEPEKPAGRAARTDLRVLRSWKQHTLLEVRIATGRTHQIRVHLSAVGYPVVGDRLYGAAALPAEWVVSSGAGLRPAQGLDQEEAGAVATRDLDSPSGEAKGGREGLSAAREGLSGDGEVLHRPEPCATEAQRFILHARRIRLAHPSTRAPLSIEAPLPPDFENVLRSLGA
jgi:23S rRNA pseudouridine1911/1915/1917 synthase